MKSFICSPFAFMIAIMTIALGVLFSMLPANTTQAQNQQCVNGVCITPNRTFLRPFAPPTVEVVTSVVPTASDNIFFPPETVAIPVPPPTVEYVTYETQEPVASSTVTYESPVVSTYTTVEAPRQRRVFNFRPFQRIRSSGCFRLRR